MCRFIDDKVFTMTNAVTALVSSMIVLVVAVIFWVCNDSRVNKEYHEEISTKLDKIQGIALNAQDILKESSETLNIEALEDLLEAKIDAAIIEEKSSAIDSNNYMALILTLVTLCVSLSAVIPYIVGKSISKFEIKNVVEDLYAKDKHDVSVKYRESVNMLLASEAHLSRMTAFELLSIYQLQEQLQKFPEPQKSSAPQNQPPFNSPFDLSIHPAWVIGWASKALIRYVTSYSEANSEQYKRFVGILIDYINHAISIFSNSTLPNSEIYMDITKRAVIDILNALAYQDTLNTPLLDSNTINTLIDVAKTLSAGRDNIIDGLNKVAYRKSHYDIYLHSKEEQETFKTRVDFYASKIIRVVS